MPPRRPPLAPTTSFALRSPRRRSRSCTSSADRARRPSASACSSSSSSARASASISSRRSSDAEELAQQVPIERQRGRTALGQRRVRLVHVGGDPVEQQRLRERRRARRIHRDDAHSPGAHVPEHLLQRGQVEHVAEAPRAWPRAGSGTSGSGRRPRAGPRRAAAAATAACGARANGAAAGARGRRPRGNAPVNSAVAGSAGDDELLDPPDPKAGPRGGPSPRTRAGGSRCRRRSRAPARPGRTLRAAGPPPPSPTARGRFAPNGERTQTRQSPSSSRKRSTTIVRSSGTAPAASR